MGLYDKTVDHLVNNAGVTRMTLFENTPDVTKLAPTLVTSTNLSQVPFSFLTKSIQMIKSYIL